MTTQQMKYFITLANTLNYTAAASELRISVSTLSRQILLMETELNVELFLRTNRSVSLTTCGMFFYNEIRKVYESYRQAESSVRHIYEGYNGAVSIGILDDLTLNGSMQDYINDFQQNYPNLVLHLERGSYKQLTEGLSTGRYDCILCFFFAIDTMVSLQYKIVEKIQEGILISSKNPLSKKDYFDPQLFKNQTFILLSPDENDYVSSGPLDFFKRNGFYPKLLYAPNLDSATLMVESGLGVCFSYGKSVGSFNPSMKFLPLKKGMTMTHSPHLVLAWHQSLQNTSAKLFVNDFPHQRI